MLWHVGSQNKTGAPVDHVQNKSEKLDDEANDTLMPPISKIIVRHW